MTAKSFLRNPANFGVLPLCNRAAVALILSVLIGATSLVAQQPSIPVLAGKSENPNPQGVDKFADINSLVTADHLEEAEARVRQFVLEHNSSADAHFLLGYIFFREIQAKATGEGKLDFRFQEEKAKASLAEYTTGAKLHAPGAFELQIVALDYILLNDYADADK